MSARATVSFVAKAILSSSDGIKHDEIKRIEGTQTASGLEVRKPRNRDLEKLRQRQGGEGAAAGADSGLSAGDGTNLTLFEQLQQNKEDKDEDYETQLRESRMPKALDDDEIAFLDEQARRRHLEQDAHVRQEKEDLEEFRAAGAAGAASSSSSSSEGSSGRVGAQSSAVVPSGFFGQSQHNVHIGSQRSRAPKITLKRRRRKGGVGGGAPTMDDGTAAGEGASGNVAKRVRVSASASLSSSHNNNNNDGPTAATSSAVLALAAYASSSDSADET